MAGRESASDEDSRRQTAATIDAGIQPATEAALSEDMLLRTESLAGGGSDELLRYPFAPAASPVILE